MTNKTQKSILLAFVLGLLLPGVGLFYAAPLGVAAVGSIVALVIYKVFAWIPLIGKVVVSLLALTSAALGVGYAKAYNRAGTRVAVSP
jgi:hypothetical protein